ncbi:MAG TPA: sugar phosphate isomerase/epimerase family protein [Anaerolineales bacterium]|nr:sugar phosphate isomerase/epimerase family protein [Anaerolineales bacterium]
MNRIGIYYAYWTHDWDADFHPLIDKAADLGFDLLEVNAGTIANMQPEARRNLKDHAQSRNLGLSHCIGLPARCDVAAPDAATRKRGLRFLEKIIRAIGEMGGGALSGIIYGHWPGTLPENADKRPYVDRSVASLKQAARVAADQGVQLNVEVVNRFEQFIMNTCQEAREYVQDVGSPSVKILLDTFHMNIEEDTIGSAVERAGGFLGHLHIGENNRRAPGRGHIPWDELASALKTINYQGDVVMEPFLMPGGEVGRDIKVFRDLSLGVDLDAEAREAVQFIRGSLGSST